jgi:hypothetical protein
MDRSALDAEIGRLLADPSHARWDTDTLHTRIEFIQQEVQALTGAVKTVESLTPTADVAEVTLDDETIDITRATLTETDGNVHILIGRSREDLDFYEPSWPNYSSSLPTQFFYDVSNRQLVLVPPPSSDYATAGALKVWEVRTPTPLAGDSSEPFDGNVTMRAYTRAVVHGVVALCLMDNGDPESLAKVKFHRSNDTNVPGEYEKMLKQINAKFTHPSVIPERIKWMPQGGRLGGGKWPSKAYPFGG